MSAPSSTAMPTLSPAELAEALDRVRTRGPLVHCLTNTVASQRTADALLAVGADPAMVDNPLEAAELAVLADAVLVNLGTPSHERTVATMRAVPAASAAGRPWVLDPVAVGPLGWRTSTARELLTGPPPAVVRGNASEVDALAGGHGGRGTASVLAPAEVLPAARDLALRLGTTIAVSGPVDHVTDGACLVRVHNGTPLLTRVTGAGCALGGLVAAFCGAGSDGLVAAVAATATVTVAAEMALETSAGPGTFVAAWLDALAALTPTELADRVRLS